MTTHSSSSAAILAEAACAAGLDTTGAALIRDGANVLYELPGGRVARIGPAGALATAERELGVARWLTDETVPVVRPLDDVAQPVVVHDRPVTWWEQISGHRHGTTAELGALLRRLHALAPTNAPELAPYDPFVGLAERITAATHLAEEDRHWLDQRLSRLWADFTDLRPNLTTRVIHGDAWQGNVAVPSRGGPLLLDLEHVSLGDPDWDLIPIAVDYVDFARLDTEDYQAFVNACGGRDVTTTTKFRTLADIQELRWVCFVLTKASGSETAARETQHRIACLRGDLRRPWTWTAF